MICYPFSGIWKGPLTYLEKWEKSGWDEEKVIEELARNMAEEFDSTQKYQIIYENKKLFDEMLHKCERVYNSYVEKEEIKAPIPQKIEEPEVV